MINPYLTNTGVNATSIRRFLATLLLLLPLIGVQAQNGPLDSSTSPGLAPGAPAGSYALSDLDSVNRFNGHLGFHLPLPQIGGRGGAGSGIMLPIEQTWTVLYRWVSPSRPAKCRCEGLDCSRSEWRR